MGVTWSSQSYDSRRWVICLKRFARPHVWYHPPSNVITTKAESILITEHCDALSFHPSGHVLTSVSACNVLVLHECNNPEKIEDGLCSHERYVISCNLCCGWSLDWFMRHFKASLAFASTTTICETSSMRMDAIYCRHYWWTIHKITPNVLVNSPTWPSRPSETLHERQTLEFSYPFTKIHSHHRLLLITHYSTLKPVNCLSRSLFINLW